MIEGLAQLAAELTGRRGDVPLLAVALGHDFDQGAADDGAIGAPITDLAGLLGAGDAKANGDRGWPGGFP